MHEGRGFLVALSTTLIGVGLAVLVASLIALATVPKQFRVHYGWVPPVGIALGIASVIAGIAAAIAWEVSWRRNRARIRGLGQWCAKGYGIRNRLSAVTDVPSLKAAKDEAFQWQGQVLDWFEANLLDYTPHFVNTGGYPYLGEPKDPGSPEDLLALRLELLAAHDTQLQRLGELLMKL